MIVARASHLAQFIEDDRVLFFTWKLRISANHGRFFGLASGKIGMRGDTLDTECHLEIALSFSP